MTVVPQLSLPYLLADGMAADAATFQPLYDALLGHTNSHTHDEYATQAALNAKTFASLFDVPAGDGVWTRQSGVLVWKPLNDFIQGPYAKQYVGNANLSSFTGNWRPGTTGDDLKWKLIAWFGQGGVSVPGTTQGGGVIAKYFGPCSEDSAQAFSSGAFLVDNGIAPFTQTFPLTGGEGDAVTQGANILTGNAVGMAAIAQAQGTSEHRGKSIGFYAGSGGARDNGTKVANYYGLYVEDVSGAGVVTRKWGAYSRMKMQTETMMWLGIFLAGSTLAAQSLAGSLTLTMQAGEGSRFTGGAGQHVIVGTGTTAEDKVVSTVVGDVVTLASALANTHNAGEAVDPTAAANIRYAAGNLTTDYGFSCKALLPQQINVQNTDGSGFLQMPIQSVSSPTPNAGQVRHFNRVGDGFLCQKQPDGIERVFSTEPMGAFTSGAYYGTPCGTNGTSAGQGVGILRATPFYVPKQTTFDRIGVEITVAGSVGALIRLGVYADNGALYPGARVLDAGTVNGTLTGGQELTINLTLNTGIYWLVSTIQGAPATQPTVRTNGASAPVGLMGLGGDTIVNSAGLAGFSMTGVTGALPDPFSATRTGVPSATRVLVRAA